MNYTLSMKAAGIIAEYNPLHQGHIHHLLRTREELQADVIIVIVTSWFSSRGLPSLLSRSDKTRLALEAGADLVIELPSVYAAQSADRFALYAIEALKSAGVEAICFGSETNDLALLEERLDRLEEIERTIEADPSRSLNQTMNEFFDPPLRANDILGLQYLRWCKAFGILPVSIQRDESFRSATATRKGFFNGEAQFLDDFFQKEQSWEAYYPILRAQLVLSPPERLADFFLVSEGIEHRLKKAAAACASWDEFLSRCVSKTYTIARIQRTCLFILLQVTKKQMEDHSSFFTVRILGMNEQGRKWLKTLPKGAPVVSRFSQLDGFLQEVETKSRFLYESVMKEIPEDRLVMKLEKKD